MKINQLLGELTKVREELMDSRVTNLLGHTMPSRGGIGQSTASATHHQLTPSSGPRKLYSEVVGETAEKRFKLMVKLKLELLTEEVKNVLRTNVNPMVMKVGIKTLKSLKDRTTEEINKL